MGLTKARLVNVSVEPEVAVEVLFNPTEYGVDRGASYAELAVPGLATPILQFVRGEAQTMNLELFLDRTDQRAGLEEDLARIRDFVEINGRLHAPPVCRFEWGENPDTFQGVVTSLKESYLLFDEQGRVLRAKATLTIKSYTPVEVQLRELRLESPDRARVRVLREGETLAHLATEAYGDPRLWRVIAEANAIDRPRFVAVGTPLMIPAL